MEEQLPKKRNCKRSKYFDQLRNCSWCEETFWGNRYNKAENQFCGNSCSISSRTKESSFITTSCEACGANIKCWKSLRRQFCSVECRQFSQRTLPRLACPICKNIFVSNGNEFCSRVCKRQTLIEIKSCKVCQNQFETYKINPYSHCSIICARIGTDRSKEVQQKSFRTKCKNGTIRKSRPELALCECLIRMFGPDNIRTQVQMFGTRIDIHIVHKNVFVEFDGKYWHGLDVQYDQLDLHRKTKFDKDRKLDEAFRGAKLTLIRVVDTGDELQNMTDCLSQLNLL